MSYSHTFQGYCACGTYVGNDPCKKCADAKAKEIKAQKRAAKKESKK